MSAGLRNKSGRCRMCGGKCRPQYRYCKLCYADRAKARAAERKGGEGND